jgi:hypothetical protein
MSGNSGASLLVATAKIFITPKLPSLLCHSPNVAYLGKGLEEPVTLPSIEGWGKGQTFEHVLSNPPPFIWPFTNDLLK